MIQTKFLMSSSNVCKLCWTPCVWCAWWFCKCRFDPLKVYIANQVVEWAWQYILDEKDRNKVREMIFANTPMWDIVTTISGEWKDTRKLERTESEKILIEQMIVRDNITKEYAIANAAHKFDWIDDYAACIYCNGTKFYHKNTMCTVRQKQLRETLL